MLTRLLRRTALAAAPVFAVATMAFEVLAGPVDIAQLAPPRTFLLVSVPDFAKLSAGFEKSELGAMWREPGVKAFVERISKDQSEAIADFLKQVNAESDDIKPPTGAVGLALFLPEGDAKPKAAEPGEGDEPALPETPPADMLLIADMGENADSWRELIDKVLERATREKHITTEEEKYGDIAITIVKPVKQEAKEEGDEDAEGAGGLPAAIREMLTGPMDTPRDLFMARAGTTMAMSSDLKVLETALDGIGGKPDRSAADSEVYKDTLAQHPGGELAYAVMFMEPLITTMREEFAQGMEFPGINPAAIFDVLGLSGIKSLSFGLRLDTADATMELSVASLIPEKKGLASLISQAAGPFEPPAFVPPDAAGVTRFSFNFAGLLDLAREVAGAMPEEQRAQVLMSIEQASGIAKPALEAMGPAVYVVNAFKQPLSAESQLTTFAIDVKDQVAVSNTIAFLAGQMGGLLEPREFDGNTIYNVSEGAFSIGIGFNRVFMGQPAAVENAMRLSGQADGARLSGEAAFKDATRTLSNDGVVYSWSDSAQGLRWTYWSMENAEKIFENSFEGIELEAEEKAEMLKNFREAQPEWSKSLPPLDSILPHLGDQLAELRATPDGFRGRLILLKPSEKK